MAISVPGSVVTASVAVNDLGAVVAVYYANRTGLGVSHGFIERGGRHTTKGPLVLSISQQ
jgi:hypothetical protein